jgi:presenilin-like A22 family membrane protease
MKHTLQVSITLLVMFLAAQFIGLLVVNAYVDVEASQIATAETGELTSVYEQLPYGIERPQINPDLSFVFLSIAMVVGTGLMLLIIKLRKVSIWKFWMLAALVITITAALSAFIPPITAFAIAAIVSYLRIFKPNVLAHNLTELLVYGGLAAIFVPIMTLKSAAILLLLIAAYDVFAVFRSKHMITLAKFQADNNMFAGLFIPKELTTKSVVSSIKTSESKSSKENYTDTGNYAVLGGGDIGFPLLFAGTALPIFGLSQTIIIPAFAALALSILLAISKKGKFYPAMPFVAAGCFVGYGILLLL